MKIQVEVREFREAFRLAAAAAPKNSPKPILHNVKLATTDDGVTLTGTDLEIGVVATVAATVTRPGAVLLSSKMYEVLTTTESRSLRLEVAGNSLTITGERSRFVLPIENADDFSSVASFPDDRYYEILGRDFKTLVRRVAFATDNEESVRYAMGGVSLEVNGGLMIAVSTDGRRLAKMEVEASNAGDCTPPSGWTVVPRKAFRLLGDLQPDDKVQVALRDNEVLLRTPRATVYSRLLEGRFPRWQDVIPKNDTRIELPVSPLAAAVRQAAICTSDESRGVEFSFAKGMLTLSSSAAEVGQTHVELPIADCVELAVILNPQYVLDFLKVLDPDSTFSLSLKDSNSAALFSADGGYCYVVMPLSNK